MVLLRGRLNSVTTPTNRPSPTAVSAYIHEKALNYKAIKWSVYKKASPRPKGAKFCDVCLSEILVISKHIHEPDCINQRREIGNKCVHRGRHLLVKAKVKDK